MVFILMVGLAREASKFLFGAYTPSFIRKLCLYSLFVRGWGIVYLINDSTKNEVCIK